MKLLITGTAGFIGSNLVRYLLSTVDDLSIISLDSLEYAGNLITLETIPGGLASERHRFVHGSICDTALVESLATEGLDGIINLAAHTHVDRAYYHPELFIRNNVEGVLNLLRVAEKCPVGRILQVSTDEVYGAARPDRPCDEDAPLRPGNYYASSKAAADLYISAALNFGKIDAVIVRGTNNLGPYQYPEKLIPLFTRRILQRETLPLYGDGRQMRDWLFVNDFCRAIWLVFTKGVRGQIYNVGAGNHLTNAELSRKLVTLLKADPALIRNVADRPGHDSCYAVNWDKIKNLGWTAHTDFDTALAETVAWYRDNPQWAETIMKTSRSNPKDHAFFERHYRHRS